MEDSIVERAKQLVSSENARFEDVVQSLETSRQGLESERALAEKQRREAADANRAAQEYRQKLEREAAKEMEKAREQAAQLVARTRAQIDSMLNEMEEMKRQQNKALSAEQKARLKAGLRNLESTADPVSKKEEGPYMLPRPLKAGDTVLIHDIDKKATVLETPEGADKVLVQAGIIKTRVPLSNLRLLEEKIQAAKPKRSVTKNVTGRAQAEVHTEIDVRGQNAEEAVMNVDAFIDSALLSGISLLTVIHGKGTGVLRTAIQKHLKHHPSVKSFRLGTFGEGEAGVTVVELK